MSEGPLLKMKSEQHNIAITNQQIKLQNDSTMKSAKAIKHVLRVSMITDSVGLILIMVFAFAMVFHHNFIGWVLAILANVVIWGGVIYGAYMHYKDKVRQAGVDLLIKKLEAQKEGD